MRCLNYLQLMIFSFYIVVSCVKCELYTSVEDLSKWSIAGGKLIDLLSNNIQAEETKLHNLYTIQKLIYKFNQNNSQYDAADGNTGVFTSVASMENPVEALISLNRYLKAIDVLKHTLNDKEFEEIETNLRLPSIDDLVGCGEALLRLQKFYQLDLDDLVQGRVGQAYSHLSMIRNDCFELGKIAYENDEYSNAIDWFRKALELEDDELTDLNDILEFIAFAAYKNDQLKLAAEMTRIWLQKDPENERALSNLEYYEEELEENEKVEKSKPLNDDKLVQDSSTKSKETKSYVDKYLIGKEFSSNDYNFADDDVVRYLCTRSGAIRNQNKCFKKAPMDGNNPITEYKIEIINRDPSVIRIYDIISEAETAYLRRKAFSRLQRSTVQTKQGLVTTDFRIAKTAWLSGLTDLVVDRIGRRIGSILNIDLTDSEDLQVVNYGIGGYYGPHLDSARETMISLSKNSSDREASRVQIGSLAQNDRMATVLMYLNQVKAGGSTVFPKLNLTVEPIERSAIVWYNIMKNGYTDERTLHTGCPVLLGSKWIATIWPREAGNTFLRPCGLKVEQ